MIFVTLGTHEQPMMRLVPVLEALAAARHDLGPFRMQGGATPLPLGWEGSPMLPSTEVAAQVTAAGIIVTHGGPASIAEVRLLGKIPVVVPRQRRYGEHVDDHQLWYCRRLAAAAEIILVEEVEQLADAIARHHAIAAALPAPVPHDAGPAIRRFSEVANRLLRRR